MKKLFIILSIFIVTATAQAGTLTVVAKGLKNSKGVVQFSLYNKDGSIPDKKLNKYYKIQRVEISNKEAVAVFTNLPKGRYAVSVFHDENSNGKIDKGLVMPVEGIGLSNFKSVNLFNPPNFKKASFLFDSNKKIVIGMIYL